MSRLSFFLGDTGFEMMTYYAVYNYNHIFEMSKFSNWAWLAAAIGYDLGWYFTHRLSHEMNFGWAGNFIFDSSKNHRVKFKKKL